MLQNPEIVTAESQPTAVVRATVAMDQIREFYDRAFPAVAEAATSQGVGLRSAFGHYLSAPTETVELEVGFTTDRPITAVGEVAAGELPGGEVARATHLGSYDGLGAAWQELFDWVTGQGRTVGESMWEVYVTEPSPELDPVTLRTDLFWPLQD